MAANDQDCSLSSKLHAIQNFNSPPSKRNTKNLSLQLNTLSASNDYPFAPPPVPLATPTKSTSRSSFPNSPTGVRLYRHPSISHVTGSPTVNEGGLKRRTTLSLSIPLEQENTTKHNSLLSSSSSKTSAASIPSFNSNSSPITSASSLSIPPSSTTFSNFPTSLKHSESSRSSNATLKDGSDGTGDLKTQTLIQNLSSIDLSDDGDNSKLNAYPHGPKCVYDPYLFLYSEPTIEQLDQFDVVINVAKELVPPFLGVDQFNQHLQAIDENIIQLSHTTKENKKLTYIYVPWTHTSKICKELPALTNAIASSLNQGRKILIHCQCGVSRSASLIVAFFMSLRNINLNDAYNMLKVQAPDISPNMSLIFQLMEWGESIGVDSIVSTPQYEQDMKEMNNL